MSHTETSRRSLAAGRDSALSPSRVSVWPALDLGRGLYAIPRESAGPPGCGWGVLSRRGATALMCAIPT
jgi:hypothetical protein